VQGVLTQRNGGGRHCILAALGEQEGAKGSGIAEGLGLTIYRCGAWNRGVARMSRLAGGGRRALSELRSSAGRQADQVRHERGLGGLAGLT
jgi:hypothetical protein